MSELFVVCVEPLRSVQFDSVFSLVTWKSSTNMRDY